MESDKNILWMKRHASSSSGWWGKRSCGRGIWAVLDGDWNQSSLEWRGDSALRVLS